MMDREEGKAVSKDDSLWDEIDDFKMVDKHYNEVSNRMKQIFEQLDEKMKQMRAMKSHLDKTREEMKENAAKAKSKIIFDVGGQRFATTKETLMSQPETYFTAMLGSGVWKVTSSYFVR